MKTKPQERIVSKLDDSFVDKPLFLMWDEMLQDERPSNPIQGILYVCGISLVLWLLILYVACGGLNG